MISIIYEVVKKTFLKDGECVFLIIEFPTLDTEIGTYGTTQFYILHPITKNKSL